MDDFRFSGGRLDLPGGRLWGRVVCGFLDRLRGRDEGEAIAGFAGGIGREVLNIEGFSAVFQTGLAGGQLGSGAIDGREHQKRGQQAQSAKPGEDQESMRLFHARW